MKKNVLLALALGLTGSTFAQQVLQAPANLSQSAQPYTKQLLTGSEPMNGTFLSNKGGGLGSLASLNGTQIGTTTYDLQSNSSVMQRLWRFPDGTMSAAFTYSSAGNLAAPDRGTGYNHYNAMGNWGSAPIARIESERGGWPTLVGTGTNGEINVLHNTTSSVLTMNRRAVKGLGTWTETNVTNPLLDMLWNRAAIGGPTNNTYHLIGLTAPSGNGGSIYQGLDGALLYYRSLDGGVTWDQQEVLLPYATSAYYTGFEGDSYAITARGNTVAIAVFPTWGDCMVMKSTDNGTTWNKLTVIDLPDAFDPDVNISDFNNDGVADTINTTDNTGSVLIDPSGNVHVWFGNMRVIEDDPSAAGWSYFPYTNGLMYWNETMPENMPQMITGMLDANNNGQLDFVNGGSNDLALYFMSLASMPFATADDNGKLYLTYSAVVEDKTNFSQHYRHVYMMTSDDGGCTWTEPHDVTGSDDFAECVFASLANSVGSDDIVHFIYQEDDEPGLAVRGDEDPYTNNKIVHVAVDADTLSATPYYCASYIDAPVTEFCPGDQVTLTAACGSAYAWFDPSGNPVGTTQSITASAFGTYTVDVTTACGVQTESVELTDQSVTNNPPTVALSATSMEICPGTSTDLSVSSPVSLGTYLWSNGSTSSTTTVTNPGTYTVTVANCGGTTTESITISLPPAPTASITGDNYICGTNDTAYLTASNAPSATWAWGAGANNATTQTVGVTNVGTYFVTVTNCAGTDTASFSVTTEPAPNAVITPSALDACAGVNTPITLSASGGVSYSWSNGSTNPTIVLNDVSESGQYIVTASNNCGVTAASTPITINIYPVPPIPSVTYNNGTFTSSAPTGNQWYLNGLAVSGATNVTYQPNMDAIKNLTVQVRVTNNGCSSDFSDGLVSVEDAASAKSISIYPNPASSLLNISFNNLVGPQNIAIKNVLGQTVYTQTVVASNSTVATIPVEQFVKGVYFVTINNGSQEFTQRVIVK